MPGLRKLVPMAKRQSLAQFIDHAVLKPDAKPMEVVAACRETIRLGLKGLCVHPCYVGLAAGFLQKHALPVAVIGFPFGATLPRVKAYEAAECVKLGAQELDMVINIGELKAGKDNLVEEDIAAVVRAAQGKPVKVIIETGLLLDREKERACQAAKKAGAAFVKTCTGFSGGKATVEDVALMRGVVGRKMGVKASGGIDTPEAAQALIGAGADRLGTSRPAAVLAG